VSDPEVAAIVPARNEERRVAATVRALLDSRRIDEVVVVDDASRDGTAERARDAGARVLRLTKHRGKGAALRAGLAATRAPVVLLCDADLASSAADVVSLLDPVLAGEADIAVGAPPRREGPSGFGLVERLGRWTVQRTTGRVMQRPLSGQRVARRDALPGDLAAGYGAEIAMTIDALAAGRRVLEVPCAFEHARTGKTAAGFAHRGRQAVDVLRAAAPRMRTRMRTGTPADAPGRR
jgi:glycosyltransferase involved in cell wall biosynthesis